MGTARWRKPRAPDFYTSRTLETPSSSMEEGRDGGERDAIGRRPRSAPTSVLDYSQRATTTQPSSIEEEGYDFQS